MHGDPRNEPGHKKHHTLNTNLNKEEQLTVYSFLFLFNIILIDFWDARNESGHQNTSRVQA